MEQADDRLLAGSSQTVSVGLVPECEPPKIMFSLLAALHPWRVFLTVAGAVASLTVAVQVQAMQYEPETLPIDDEFSDTLSNKDIPTGQGGFARDYHLDLEAGDRVEMILTSDSFDTIIKLIGSDGTTIAENDDGPDGTTNSLLFTRIQTSDTYTVRVQAFGKASGGPFVLQVTRLQPAR